MNYPKGDEERVTSACRPGIYVIGGECSRVDRSRAPSLFSRNFAPLTRGTPSVPRIGEKRAPTENGVVKWFVFLTRIRRRFDRERERESVFEEARV